jgi:geranylgeranylglycerol-phosphate geranylgeranyltransferase
MAMLQLMRIDSSILGFLSLFVPIYARTLDLKGSLERAIPLLFICICTFIANDLDDLERDKINHPQRPLPARHLTPALATAVYFISLALALFLTRSFVGQRVALWYYALMALSISYRFVVEHLPSAKAFYVALVISVPLLIIALSYPNEGRLYIVAIAGFSFALGRELCMDIDDRKGDVVSLIHRVDPTTVAAAAFVSQGLGVTMLLSQVRRLPDVFPASVMVLVLVTSGISWFNLNNHKIARRIMKLQLAIGLYFLI